MDAIQLRSGGSHLLDIDSTQTQAGRLADGRQEALQAGAPQLLTAATVDGETAQTWREVPDVHPRDARELEPPEQRSPAAAHQRQKTIATRLAAVETSTNNKHRTVKINSDDTHQQKTRYF